MKSIYSNENCYSPIIYNNYSNTVNPSVNELETFIPKFIYENEDINNSLSEENRYLLEAELVNKEKDSQNIILNKNNHLESQKIKDKISNINYYKQYTSELNTKNSSKILGNKRKRNIGEIPLKENVNGNGNEIMYQRLIQKFEKQKGRKKKDQKEKGSHTKYSEDNIMRKIKSNFLNYCYNLLNKSLADKNTLFVRLSGNIAKNLKKDYNLDLLNTTIKDLYSNSIISGKYIKQKKIFSIKNKIIINHIFKDNKEKETIQILNLTYFELFRIFRRKILDIDFELKKKIKNISILNDNNFNDIKTFLSEVEDQERNKNEKKENIQAYIKKIQELCISYENWFLSKKGRNRNKSE